MPLIIFSFFSFSQTKKNPKTGSNINIQIGNNNKNYQKTTIINKIENLKESRKKFNTDLTKSKQLNSFISNKSKKIKILILPFYFKGPSNQEPIEKFEVKLFAALSELISKDTLDVGVVKLDDFRADTSYSTNQLFKLKDTSKINLIIFGSYERNEKGDIVNCNWLSDSISMHLPSIFPGKDNLLYRNSMVSGLFHEQYDLIEYRKNKSLSAPLFITFFSLGVKVPFYNNPKISDIYFNKAFQFASSKKDTLAVYRFRIFTDSNSSQKLFYCNEILNENPFDSLIIYYKYRALVEKGLYKDALNTVKDLSKFNNSSVGSYILYLEGKYLSKEDLDSALFLLKEGIKLTYLAKPDNIFSKKEDYDRNTKDRGILMENAMKIFYQSKEYDSVLKYYNIMLSEPVIKQEIFREIEIAKEHSPGYFMTRIAHHILYPVGMALMKTGKFKEGQELINIFINDYDTLFDVFYSDIVTKRNLEDPWYYLAKHYIDLGNLQEAGKLIGHSLIFLRKRVWNKNIDLNKEILDRETLLNLIRNKK